MTKFKKYLAVFAVTVLLVSAFAPGLILAATVVGSGTVTVLEYANNGGFNLSADATAYSQDEECWAEAKIYRDGSLFDWQYSSSMLPPTGPGYALATAQGAMCDTRTEVTDHYSGMADYGGFTPTIPDL